MQLSTSLQNRAPHLVNSTHYCVTGDVSVAEGAAIAPGVVLQASAGSRIVIASGACLAGGVCIQSRKGVLTIGPGANLGANVLIVGKGEIGANACISPGSTVINPQISAEQIVPPNALVENRLGESRSVASKSTAVVSSGFASGSYTPNAGDYVTRSNVSSQASSFQPSSFQAPSFQASSFQSVPQVTPQQENDTFVNTFVEPPPVGPKALEIPDLGDQNGQYVDPSVQNNGVQLNNGSGSSASNSSALSVTANNRVYGKDQVSQLLSTLFPNRAT